MRGGSRAVDGAERRRRGGRGGHRGVGCLTAPSSGHLALALVAVVAGCVGAAAAVEAWRRSGTRLWLVGAVGCAAIVAGIAGQRAVPPENTVRAADGRILAAPSVGPWDAGVHLPLVDLAVTPVAIGGGLVALVALSALLFLPPRPGTGAAVGPRVRLEDDDAV